MKPSGYFIRCKSQFDGSPIAIVLTGFGRPSANTKTGPMIQSFIVRLDMLPGLAVRTRKDFAICGFCPLRSGGGCYVELKVVHSVVEALRRSLDGHGPYLEISGVGWAGWSGLARRARGQHLRLSAYGDPAALTPGIIRPVCSLFDGWTGYTHAWRRALHLRPYVMASVHSPRERLQAIGLGWRTFRILPRIISPIAASEILCPSYAGVRCVDCLRCSGGERESLRKDIAIVAHGSQVRKVQRTCKERI